MPHCALPGMRRFQLLPTLQFRSRRKCLVDKSSPEFLSLPWTILSELLTDVHSGALNDKFCTIVRLVVYVLNAKNNGC